MTDVKTPDNWAKMNTAERVAVCHAFAREAAQLAQAAHPDKKHVYKELAAKWNTLAAEIENSAQQDRQQPRASA